MSALPIVLVAAIADNGVIGDDNKLIWRLKTDLRRFRQITTGCPIIMGRKTFLSIGKPLPGRETIVLTRNPDFRAEGVHVASAMGPALQLARDLGAKMGAHAIIIGGGSDIYGQALPFADRLELTVVHAEPEGDAVFPNWDRTAFEQTANDAHASGPDDEFAFTFATYRRRHGAGLCS